MKQTETVSFALRVSFTLDVNSEQLQSILRKSYLHNSDQHAELWDLMESSHPQLRSALQLMRLDEVTILDIADDSGETIWEENYT